MQQIHEEFVNGIVQSDRLDLIQPYWKMVTIERKHDNHNLSAILASHRLDAAKTCLHSWRFRNEIDSMCLLYAYESVVAECIVYYRRPFAKYA